MGAYSLQIQIRCSASLCTSRAVVEVFNTFNSSCGRFCKKHGAKKLAELKKNEAATVKAVMASREDKEQP